MVRNTPVKLSRSGFSKAVFDYELPVGKQDTPRWQFISNSFFMIENAFFRFPEVSKVP